MSTQPTPPTGEPVEDLGFELPPPTTSSRTKVIIVAVVVIAGAFGFGYYQHKKVKDDVPVASGEKTTSVEVMKATVVSSGSSIVLPGTVKALEETKIYPHVTGYIKDWKVDIGDKVAAGQLLAEVATPDLDAQLNQGRAQLAQADATLKQAIAQRTYSSANSKRYEGLSDQKLVAQGQVEQIQAQAQSDVATVAADEANIVAQQANVRRLVELVGFTKITAPFAGTITTRSIDRGTLVTDGGTTPLFTIDAIDPVRVFVDAPQSIAATLANGTDANISAREFAGRKFPGKVARSAGALSTDLHTMVTEIRVPNPDSALLPGMYVQAEITLPVPHKVLQIPATALYSDANGLRVGVVTAGKVHFAPITIERDAGSTLQIATGLTGDENIIKIAVPSLLEGDTVEVAAAPATQSKPK
ncbi:MAG TPA: efflux RND transporter periplasmic adaptor subunit [Kofleriaceae bacterium]|nr:efflux RND transporter periplasmic adaptor subunit [Kofleriaceae bacterium]